LIVLVDKSLGGGNSNIFDFSALFGEDSHFDDIIFFKGVGSTTNQISSFHHHLCKVDDA